MPYALALLSIALALVAWCHPVSIAGVPQPWYALIGLGIVIASLNAVRAASERWTIERRRTALGDDTWHPTRSSGWPWPRTQTFGTCTLRGGGHRMSTHVILTFADRRARTFDVVVWRDAVPACTFSELHFLLAWPQARSADPTGPCATLIRPARTGAEP